MWRRTGPVPRPAALFSADAPGLMIETDRRAGGVVLSCAGEIDASNVDGLERALLQSIESSTGELEVDLSRIGFVGSCAIGALLRAHRTLNAEGRSLTLRAAPPALRLFQVTALDQVFRVRPA